jgi:hypothetical protein
MPLNDEHPVFIANGEYYFKDAAGNPIKFVTSKSNLVIHATTADPASPVVGEMWLRTDL